MTDTQPPVLVTRRRPAVVAVLLALALVCAVAGTIFVLRAHTLRGEANGTDRAVIDAKLTSQVVGQVSTGLAQVLSYDYAHPQVAQAAARKWLAGDAPAQYKVLFTQLQQLAGGQKLTLVAKVVSAGVTSLSSNRAQLLVFVDQQSTRASDGRSSVSAAQVQIGASKRGDLWQITELRPL